MIRIHNRFLKNRFERSVREASAGEYNRQEVTTNDQTTTTSAGSTTAAAEENPTEVVEERVVSFYGSPPFSSSQSSQTASEPISGGDCRSDGEKKCTNAAQAILDDIRHNRGARSVAEGEAWRRQAPEAAFSDLPRQENVGCIGEAVADDKTKQTSHISGKQYVPRSVHEGDANIINKTGGGSSPSSKGNKKRDTRSSSSWNRNLEYLFLTVTKSGFGAFDCDVEDGRGGAREEGDADEKSRRTSPDPLQLAEDGFCLPKWSKVKTSPISAAATSTIPVRFSTPMVAAAAGPSATVKMKRTSMPTPLMLSRYLSEADISCVSGASECETGTIRDDQAASSSSFGGLDSTKMPSLMRRLLVVKVYTGRNLQVSSPRLGGRESKVLSEAWASGFKSVSVSPVARWEGSAEQIGGGGCRNQVRFKMQYAGQLVLYDFVDVLRQTYLEV